MRAALFLGAAIAIAIVAAPALSLLGRDGSMRAETRAAALPALHVEPRPVSVEAGRRALDPLAPQGTTAFVRRLEF